METLLLYALCTASLFYLGSRAVITSWLWGRYPHKLAMFLDCSACSGTWYGALVGYVGGFHLGLSFLGMPGDRPETVAAVGLCSMAFTPIVAGYVQRGFDTLGSTVEPEVEAAEPEPEASPPAEPAGHIAADVGGKEQMRERMSVSGELRNTVPLPGTEIVAIKDRSGATLGTITIPALPKGSSEPGTR